SGASTPTGDQRERLIEVIEAGIVLLWPLIYRGQGRRAAILAVVIANLADRLDDRDYALPYAALGETCRQLGLARFARIYTARARQALDRDVCFIEFGATARIFIQAEAGHGRWSRARRLVERALDCSERVGDRRGYEGLLCTRALVELTRGPDARIETIARRLDTLSEQSGNPLAALWNNVIWMLLAYQRDDLGAALDHAASVSADRLIDALPVTRCHLLSVEAACLARRGEFDCAFGIAWRAFEHFEALTEGGDVNFFLLHSYRALAEACYHCGVADAESAYQPARALDLFDDVVDRLGNLAKRFPAARPALLRNRGRKAALKGDTAAASALYSQSLRQARRLDMPFDDKLTRRAAARLGGQ
ncbi:MAG: hypothetical protein ACOCV2_10645, partial [Persicimonas sp.]